MKHNNPFTDAYMVLLRQKQTYFFLCCNKIKQRLKLTPLNLFLGCILKGSRSIMSLEEISAEGNGNVSSMDLFQVLPGESLDHADTLWPLHTCYIIASCFLNLNEWMILEKYKFSSLIVSKMTLRFVSAKSTPGLLHYLVKKKQSWDALIAQQTSRIYLFYLIQ